MKKMNKKGFTIVELVIVIAVIAILAAVLIPTFSGIIKKAEKSSNEQKATAAYKAVLGVTDYGTLSNDDANVVDAYILVEDNTDNTKDVWYQVENGEVKAATAGPDNYFETTEAANGATAANAVLYVNAKGIYTDYADELDGAPVYVYYKTNPAAANP